jgi:hypothetical protein
VFDREKVFIERVLQLLLTRYPRLKVVFEHITTSDAAAFVAACGANVAATITAHHLLYNRNAIFAGGVRRTTIACRFSNVRSIGGPCCVRPPPATTGSSSGPIPRRMRVIPRRLPAAVPGATRRMPRSNCMLRRSRQQALWIGWKLSPVSMVPIFTGCRAIPTR